MNANSTLVRAPLALFTRLRLVLTRHEELTGIVVWAAAIGFAGAIASVVFREGIRLFELLITGYSGSLVHIAASLPWWLRIVIPVAGGVAAGLTLHFGMRALRAKPAMDYMEAIVVGSGVIGARATFVRSLSSLLTIASGGSIGREGPMVQLAALIGSKLGGFVRAPVPRLRLMVACGAAAGIAAAYNAPIAGALFVAEIVMGSIAMESFGPLLVASVTANATLHNILGYGPVYQVPAFNLVSNWELVLYAILGVVLGHLAPPFLAFLAWSKQQFARINAPIYVLMALGGLMVGGISVVAPQVWGNGYSVVSDILNGKLAGQLLLLILAAKVLSTAATVGSGAVGGVFTPTLFVGAAVGALFGEGLHFMFPATVPLSSAYGIVGMGGFLAATTHAPLTSILMMFEMTLNYQVVLPLMLACVTSHYTAKVYRRGESIYHDALMPDPADPSGADDDWRLFTVSELVKPCTAVVRRGATVEQVLNGLPKKPVQAVYVINDDKELVASVSPHTLLEGIKTGQFAPSTDIEAVTSPVTSSLRSDMPLGAALDAFLRANARVLPVTSGQWQAILIGEVSRHDLLLAVQDRMSKRPR